MKRFAYLLTILALLILNMFCTVHDSPTSPRISDGSIWGSGHYVTEIRTLPDFHSVEMSTAGNVNITYGTEQDVAITVDDNILKYITIAVHNGKLIIGVTPNTRLSNYNLTVNLTMTDLEELTTSSAGSIVGKNRFSADHVRLILNSAGNISLELEAEELNSSLSSAGNLFLSGSVVEHRSTLSSAGSLHAFNLNTDKTLITLNSAGNAEVYVTQLLDAGLFSVGSLFYKGNPKIISNITSLGRIINAN